MLFIKINHVQESNDFRSKTSVKIKDNTRYFRVQSVAYQSFQICSDLCQECEKFNNLN